MKTTLNTLTAATPNFPMDFPGVVINPATGRKCALAIDICRAWQLNPSQVSACRATLYDGRYHDLEEVAATRRATRPAGRPKVKGMILAELVSTIAACVAGTAVAAAIIAATSEETGDNLRGAVSNRGMTVATMEELGFSGASEARAQFNAGKPVALAGIAALETLNLEGE